MSKIIRFQFSKGPEVRFLSHLDLVRTMERAIRRANLPIAYSEGFTPRPVMSYGFALPVGVLSIAEYGDYRFVENLDPQEFMACYNKYLPPGFRVLNAETLPEGAPALMSEINAAAWEVTVPSRSVEEVESRVKWLSGVDSFMVERKTKKGTRSLDIRPLLYDLPKISATPQGTVIHCLTGLGNEGNLRLEELGMLLDFNYLQATITRIGQFKKIENQYCSPLGNRG